MTQEGAGLTAKVTFTYKMSRDMKFYESVAGLHPEQDYTGLARQLGGRAANSPAALAMCSSRSTSRASNRALLLPWQRAWGTTGLSSLAGRRPGNGHVIPVGICSKALCHGQSKWGLKLRVSKLTVMPSAAVRPAGAELRQIAPQPSDRTGVYSLVDEEKT